MTSELKCPVCGKQMKIGMLDPDDSMGTVWMSIMPCDCVCSYGASKAVWKALIQTKQDLEILKEALHVVRNQYRLVKPKGFSPRGDMATLCAMGEFAEKALEKIEQKENQ